MTQNFMHRASVYLLVLNSHLLLAAPTASAQTVPSGMTYQGRLTDASSAPVPDGSGYEIEVRLWSASTGGTLLWGSRCTGVPLKSGAFNLILGSGGTPIAGATTTDLKAVFSTPTVYIGLTTTKSASGAAISSPIEILPRQQIFSTPYAFRAETATTAVLVQPDGVLSSAIKDGEVKTSDIATASIIGTKIASESIQSYHIAPQTIAPNKLAIDMAILVDEKPTGTPAGPAPSMAWIQRALNKVTFSQGNSISLSNNIITLKTGLYYIEGRVPGYNTQRQCSALRESGTGTEIIRGSSEHSYSSSESNSILTGVIDVTTTSKNFEVWQYIQRGVSPDGLGVETNAQGSPEIYTTLKITRIK
jgi:hypothetical protein